MTAICNSDEIKFCDSPKGRSIQFQGSEYNRITDIAKKVNSTDILAKAANYLWTGQRYQVLTEGEEEEESQMNYQAWKPLDKKKIKPPKFDGSKITFFVQDQIGCFKKVSHNLNSDSRPRYRVA